MDVHLLSAKVVVFLKNRNALRPNEKRPKEMHKKREREREREKSLFCFSIQRRSGFRNIFHQLLLHRRFGMRNISSLNNLNQQAISVTPSFVTLHAKLIDVMFLV